MPATIVIAVAIGLFVEHAWLMLLHRQRMGSDPKDRPQDPLYSSTTQAVSFALIFLFQACGVYRLSLIALGQWDAHASAFNEFLEFLPLPANSITLIAGALIFHLGVGLRVWAIRILGRLFTFEIGIRQEHKIIEEGPYRILRHPSYTGYLVMLVGLGIAYASLFGMLAGMVGTIIFFLLRMNHEEKMLTKHFGQAYSDYMKRTWRLIPYVY